MSALSPLQLLPPHVVRLIVDHVAGSSRVVFDDVVANSLEYRMLLKPLLWVSHNFRAVAYSHLCDNFELDFYNNFEPNLYNKALGYILKHRMPAHCRDMDYRTFNYLGYSTHHLAKDITIILDERTVYSGEALEMVSRAPYDGCSFPLARKITFTFVLEKTDRVDKNNWNDPLIAEANIGAFVERIKQMAPLAGTIIVRPASRDDIPSISNQHFGYLASRLYQLAYRIECIYNPSNVDPIRLQLDMVCNLTYVSYTSWSDVDSTYQFSQLARINARTLQSLGFHCRHYIDILRLVQDTGGNDVTYPRLLALKLCSVSNSNALKRPVFHGAAPFPILRRLRINLECPFDDATFFRGNAATLEWLNMRLDSLNASMLRKYKMFVPGSHPKLQSVKLGYTDDFGSDLLASPAETIQFMYNIGSGAAVREHVQMGHPRNYVHMSLSLGSHACIQVLSLPNLHPDLWQVITLIKSLPLLSDLQISMPSLGPMPDGVTMDELPEQIISNYAPMGKRFRCWRLNREYILDCSGPSTCVLLLALACPNFDYATSHYCERMRFMEQMKKDIRSDRFKSYVPRLRRLLFSGWNGKQY